MVERDPATLSIALVAHDACKDAMASWAKSNVNRLEQFNLFSTGTTGRVVSEATGLPMTKLLSGPLGGDQQLGARIAEGELDALFFFVDSMSPLPHDVDVKALLRISNLCGIAIATNERTATLVLNAMTQQNSEMKN